MGASNTTFKFQDIGKKTKLQVYTDTATQQDNERGRFQKKIWEKEVDIALLN